MDSPRRTPDKPASARTLTELYQSSLRKPASTLRMCLLCLLCSSDCDSSRCSNPQHVTCRECTYEWLLDRQCPICRGDSQPTMRKPRKCRRTDQDLEERLARRFTLYEERRGTAVREEEEESEPNSNA